MARTETEGTRKKVEGILSIVSGLSGIASFILDYPNLAFVLVLLFGIGAYLYMGRDFSQLLNESKTVQSPKPIYWLKAFTSNHLLGALFLIFLAVIIFIMQFFYKELGFVFKQGWVEKVDYDYQYGMEPMHLSSLAQDERTLEIINIIDPVIYHDDSVFLKGDEIRFEGWVDHDSDLSDGSFGVEVAGKDPNNSILAPSGNFVSNLSDAGYQSFPISNDYTYFVRVYSVNEKRSEFIRLHFINRSTAFDEANLKLKIRVIVSYLNNGSDRFNGLLTP